MAQEAADTRHALSFGMAASAVMCDPNHTHEARVLYAILACYVRGFDRVSHRTVPNQHRLAAMLGTDRDGFQAALTELEDAGHVTATWQSNRRGRVSVVYQLHDSDALFAAHHASSEEGDR
ncbi:hypothetical protein B0E38_06473 [Streptomyces sp. 111WW2]|nr:hypothetical protein B0E38_06473 [Streptomyces sp. 111WW2]